MYKRKKPTCGFLEACTLEQRVCSNSDGQGLLDRECQACPQYPAPDVSSLQAAQDPHAAISFSQIPASTGRLKGFHHGILSSLGNGTYQDG